MTRSPLTLALFFSLAAVANAQQSGDFQRDYTINGNGSLASSYVTTNVAVQGTMTNSYFTQVPGAPVIWALATGGTIGWFGAPGVNSVDVGPAGLGFLLDGTNNFVQTAANLFAFTNGAGAFSISLSVPTSLLGTTYYFAMLHVTASSPQNFYVSQTHRVNFVTDPGACSLPGATNLALTDDSFSTQPFGFSFPFYGTSYTECHVGSNGYVTFVTPDTTYFETVAWFLSGPPRIAEQFNDMNPGAGGTVTWSSNNSNAWEVCFNAVPEFYYFGSNSFRVTATLNAGGVGIVMGYNAAMTNIDCIVGLSPGTNIDPLGLPLNLSAGPNSINANQAPYELFISGSTFDLQGASITWLLSPVGQPVGQF